MVRPLLAFSMLITGAVLYGAEKESTPAQEALKAYSEMNYTQARKIAGKIPDSPEGQLVRGLCDLYDRSHQNIARGQLTLAELYYDRTMPEVYRLEAGVALARSAQLMKERRNLYGSAADRYDHIKIYREIVREAPDSSAGRDAFFYLVREKLEDPAQTAAAFEELERFFRDFKGDAKLLPPLHLLAEYEYIRRRGDYRSAVRHLQAGYEIGFANPSENRSGLFRLAFLYYKKLDDKPMAEKYLKLYLERHPYSGNAVVAKRFLEELEAEK